MVLVILAGWRKVLLYAAYGCAVFIDGVDLFGWHPDWLEYWTGVCNTAGLLLLSNTTINHAAADWKRVYHDPNTAVDWWRRSTNRFAERDSPEVKQERPLSRFLGALNLMVVK